jgi:hypothetical protein
MKCVSYMMLWVSTTILHAQQDALTQYKDYMMLFELGELRKYVKTQPRQRFLLSGMYEYCQFWTYVAVKSSGIQPNLWLYPNFYAFVRFNKMFAYGIDICNWLVYKTSVNGRNIYTECGKLASFFHKTAQFRNGSYIYPESWANYTDWATSACRRS